MTSAYRWPLHPQPQPHEALSSWVARLAHEYGMTWEAFFGDGLGMDSLDDQCLDRQPPTPLVQALI